MDVQLAAQKVQEITGDAVVVGAASFKRGEEQEVILSPAAQQVDKTLNGLLQEVCASGEFRGHLGELLTLHSMGHLLVRRVLVVGLGALDKVTTQTFRRASAVATRHLQRTGAKTIALALSLEHPALNQFQSVAAQVEGALLGAYGFRIYQNKSDGRKQQELTQVRIVPIVDSGDKLNYEQAVRQGQILAEATNFARDLINEPANVLTPRELARRARLMAEEFGLECEVFEQAKIEQLGMGGLIGVSQGSAQPPQFIILRYRGKPDSQEKGAALIGKGITFDSGGISIKPAAGMDEMKGDMSGAAAVIGAMRAIGALKPACNVTALVPTCENMPSATSYRPGDILRILNGKTIEIVNTDAEGRLVLADALSFAVKEGLSPIIDLATLTGGIVVALGSVMSGLFCNDDALTQELLAAGRVAGEKYWPMPLDEEYNENIRSEIADLKQTGGRYGSSINAAKVLEHFVGETPWAHLDIAGTNYIDSKKSYQEKGATGVGVRTLVEFVLQRAH